MESAERASHYLAGYSGTGRRKCGSGQIHSGGSLLHEAGTLLEGRMGAREGPQSFIDNLRENTELFPFIIESENRTTISEVDTIGSSNYLEEAEKKNIDLSQMFGVVMSGNIDI